MNATLQQKIAPRDIAVQTHKINGQKPAVMAEQEQKTDFKELLLNSNQEIKLKRDAQSNGDLSKAKDYQSFLKSLNESTRQSNMPKNKLDKNDFLTLFITQLQQQDPLKPKDGAEMASQLAQFNSLEQMVNINSSLERLEKKTTEGHNIQYPDFIGKTIATPLNKLKIEHGQIADNQYEIESPVSQILLEVRDNTGALIARSDQGSRKEGVHNIEWDGKDKDGKVVPDGIYQFTLKKSDANQKDIAVPALTRTRITGVDLKDQQSPFLTEIGKISFSDLSRIGETKLSDKLIQKNIPSTGESLPEMNSEATGEKIQREKHAQSSLKKPGNLVSEKSTNQQESKPLPAEIQGPFIQKPFNADMFQDKPFLTPRNENRG
ncbi:MAG: flagellar hook assembly protein FlgD [Deltaproteobacteria bacterium]|nr:flagellar hook assembly protein FlgD [Deltaproteobacteria bacterium]